jgi:hypothetical protein
MYMNKSEYKITLSSGQRLPHPHPPLHKRAEGYPSVLHLHLCVGHENLLGHLVKTCMYIAYTCTYSVYTCT